MEDRIITYGGQAVIEGVLMRGQKGFAIAMRDPDGEIVLHKEKLANVYQLRHHKNPVLARHHPALGCARAGHARAHDFSQHPDRRRRKVGRLALYLTIAISLAIGIGLFFLLPGCSRWLGGSLMLRKFLREVVCHPC